MIQAVQQESLFVGGRWITPSTDRSIQVVSPASGETVAEIGYGAASDATAAVAAAAEAFPAWSRLPARQRSDTLMRIYALLVERAEEIGLLLARESGKRLPEGVGEIRLAAEYFRWFAEQAPRPVGDVAPQESPNRRHLTLAQPAGVALCLTPWNFPVSIQARKLAPALAAGCTVVARASEKAPLAVIEMFRCLQEAGLPEGVANLIQGPAGETTSAMLEHPAVRVVSFTGSTGVGRLLMKQAAERIVRPLPELAGDASFIVFHDAELPKAVEGAMLAKFRNNGQSCIAANRFLVQEEVYDQFCRLFAERVDAKGKMPATGPNTSSHASATWSGTWARRAGEVKVPASGSSWALVRRWAPAAWASATITSTAAFRSASMTGPRSGIGSCTGSPRSSAS